jgi:hypothetical protein
MVNKKLAKKVAIREINKRIVTKRKAKAELKNWITENSSTGVFDKYILDFWIEVIKQSEKL